jgi:ribonuclease HI
MEKLVIFTDGGARGNPGPAGIGVVFWKEDEGGNRSHLMDFKEYIGEHTNNFAEYSALIAGLEKAKGLNFDHVRCFLDSELVVKQLQGLYKIKEETLKPLASKVLALSNKFKTVTYTHIPREKNVAADKLVNLAIDAAVKEK